MRILLLDIETAPNTVFCWGLYEQDISLDQIVETSYILCWSAKWLGESAILFRRTPHAKRSSRRMLRDIHSLMEEADIIVTYNGNRFDIPTLNREFLLYGLPPPAPSKLIDLYQIAKRTFRFASHKMDHLAKELGIQTKTAHEGFKLWVKCMQNDRTAWSVMEKYNRNDVRMLEGIYQRLISWLPNQGYSLRTSGLCCPKCGSTEYQQRGFAFSQVSQYRRFQCGGCHGWFRINVNELAPAQKAIAL